jgi:hypothetical protein
VLVMVWSWQAEGQAVSLRTIGLQRVQTALAWEREASHLLAADEKLFG